MNNEIPKKILSFFAVFLDLGVTPRFMLFKEVKIWMWKKSEAGWMHIAGQ